MKRYALLAVLALYGCGNASNPAVVPSPAGAAVSTTPTVQSVELLVNEQPTGSSSLNLQDSITQVNGLVIMSNGTANVQNVYVSSNPAVLTVDPNGYLVGNKQGNAMLTIISSVDSSKSVSVNVAVLAPTSPATLSTIEGLPFTAVLNNSPGTMASTVTVQPATPCSTLCPVIHYINLDTGATV